MASLTTSHARKILAGVLLLLGLAVLAGCQVELYSGVEQREGNDMLAVLLNEGIPAKKIPVKDQMINLFVDERDVARAVNVLKRNGYPRDKFDRIGDIFKKEGLISSPTEERIRFIYAISQNISETLSQIDGVVTARVQVVLPENKPFDDTTVPASAAVFIKHRADSPLEEMIPAIKTLVTNSIEGLAYDKISVAMFPSKDYLVSDYPSLVDVWNIRMTSDSVGRFWLVVGVLFALLVVALACNGFLLLRSKAATPEEPA